MAKFIELKRSDINDTVHVNCDQITYMTDPIAGSTNLYLPDGSRLPVAKTIPEIKLLCRSRPIGEDES